MREIADYYIEQMMMEEYYERESIQDDIENYILTHDNDQIVKDARWWLADNPLAAGRDRNMVLGILAYYRGYQKLSDKQKRSLAYRILFL